MGGKKKGDAQKKALSGAVSQTLAPLPRLSPPARSLRVACNYSLIGAAGRARRRIRENLFLPAVTRAFDGAQLEFVRPTFKSPRDPLVYNFLLGFLLLPGHPQECTSCF